MTGDGQRLPGSKKAGRKVRLLALLCAALLGPAAASARDILLGLPLACDLTDTCFVQNHVDRDPGPGAADYTCALQSYDGHDGTDFALPDLAMMVAGVAVVASAPGTVKAARDGEVDALQGVPGAPDVRDKECGNGVLIDHGGGWETQYCHMKQGSVGVEPGLRVRMGQQLGQVGLSGETEFPHVHLTVRHDGMAVDPFHPEDVLICGTAPDHSLWQDPPPYQPGGIIAAGFGAAIPTFEAIKAGIPVQTTLPATAPALVLWVHLFGSRAGDEVRITITGPSGPVLDEVQTLEKPQARLFRAAGKRLTGAAWPAGAYIGTSTLTRGSTEIEQQTVTITVAP